MAGFVFPDATFINDFDSANLFKVEQKASFQNQESKVKDGKIQPASVLTKRTIDAEYELWTCKDCQGTAHENPNRSWFYFGVQPSENGKTLLLNIVNLNRQGKLYSQGMGIMFKTVPSKKSKWERIRDRIEHKIVDGNSMLSFTFHFAEASPSITYFAFCYPFSYIECQQYLDNIDTKYLKQGSQLGKSTLSSMIYYHRETLCYTLDNLNVDLITISSMNSITSAREKRLDGLFPDKVTPRSHIFEDKKVVFVSSRVHPGETQSSFVMNGLIEFLLRRNDPRSSALRDIYVFKLIPMLNPDGVKRGHYRTDSRGLNLNRVYSQPELHLHPSIYGAKSLIMYYHTTYGSNSYDANEDINYDNASNPNNKNNIIRNSDQENSPLFDDAKKIHTDKNDQQFPIDTQSGLAYYIDLHGHASKRGCFMYANHLLDESAQAKCMLLPKIMSINSPSFDFAGCNFSEKNMYTKDKRDGLSKEGSGRVAVYKATLIPTCYTLECNYNTGRMINYISPATSDNGRATPPLPSGYVTPYTIATFEEIGQSIAISILDAVNKNPWSRIKSSEYHSLQGVQNWIKRHLSKSKKIQTKNKRSDNQSKTKAYIGILSGAKDGLLANKDKGKPSPLTTLESIANIKKNPTINMAIDGKTKITLKRARCQSSPFPLPCNRPMSHFKHKSVSSVGSINQININTSKVKNVETNKVLYNAKEKKIISEKLSSQHKDDYALLPALKSKSALKTRRKFDLSKQTKMKPQNNNSQQTSIKGNENQLSIPVLNSRRVVPSNKNTIDSQHILQIKNHGKLDILMRPGVELPTHKFPCIDNINDDKDPVAYWVDG